MTKKKNSVTVLITHSAGTFGPDQALINYLVNKKTRLHVLQHALIGGEKMQREYFYYERGMLHHHRTTPSPHLGFIQYLSDWITTQHYLKRLSRENTISLLVGVNPLNFLAAYSTKVKPATSIFYSIDYSPKRFSSPLLNFLYRYCDRRSAQRATTTYNVSHRAIAARIKDGAPADQMVYTPNGVNSVQTNLKKEPLVAYVGTISRTKGLDTVLEAWKLVQSRLPKAKLVIVGTGPDEAIIKAALQQNSRLKSIKFLGKQSHTDVLKLLTRAQVGVAMYNEAESYTWYCDPMKVREYISLMTIPILTPVPEISEDIRRHRAGIVVEDAKRLADAIVTALKEPEQFSSGLIKMQKHMLWNDIFDRALQQSTNAPSNG